MAVLGGVNRHLSSESTLGRCPEFERFTFGDLFGAYGLGTVIQLLGLGIGLDWWEYPLYRIPSTPHHDNIGTHPPQTKHAGNNETHR